VEALVSAGRVIVLVLAGTVKVLVSARRVKFRVSAGTVKVLVSGTWVIVSTGRVIVLV
jgi:hypothetical protein